MFLTSKYNSYSSFLEVTDNKVGNGVERQRIGERDAEDSMR